VTGPGGVGKTRLAIAAVRSIQDAFSDGAVFVPLAAVTEPTLVLPAMAQALDIRQTFGRPLVDALIASLRDRHLLLVLDNFEHVLPAAANLATLLAACPRLTALVTSRAPLRLLGEHRVQTPPLAVPAVGDHAAVDCLSGYAAVTLFVERARSVQHEFTLDAGNVEAIVEICRRLDGLPLAIELAAAWVPMLPPPELLRRLEHRLLLLQGGSQDQPVRLQTMRHAIAWSYDLLSEDEALLFRRLAVFLGGFTIEAAEFLWHAAQGTVPGQTPVTPVDPLPVLSGLIDKSLVQPSHTDGSEPRFTMLETMREFGLEHLADRGEEETVRAAHAAYCLALAERTAPMLRGAGARAGLVELKREHGNLRAALAWFAARGEAEALLRLAAALGYFWSMTGYWTEGNAWLERALAADLRPSLARLEALENLGENAGYQGDIALAETVLREGLALARRLSAGAKVSSMLHALGAQRVDQGRYTEGEALLAESVAEARRAGDTYNEALSTAHLGAAAWGRGDLCAASTRLEAARCLGREAGHPMPEAVATRYLGLIAAETGEHVKAAERHRAHAFGYDPDSPHFLARAVPDVAALAAMRGEAEQAARLFGAAAVLAGALGFAPAWPERGAHERAIARVRTALGDDAFETAADAGCRLPREQILAEVLAVLDAADRSQLPA
jgi:predicted ATPase